MDRDADLLLAERAQRRAAARPQVALPRRCRCPSLVTLARDPAELARQVRRPMPRPPAPQARRGTEFHRWLEERFGQPQLIDADELPGATTAEDGTDATELAELRAAFEAERVGRPPAAEVEVPFETLIGDRLVRGRIDAVFADSPDGGYDVVDWKTGRPPSSAAERPRWPSSWPPTGWPGRRWPASRWPPSGPRSTTWPRLTVRPADLIDEAGLAALIDQVPTDPVS